MSTMNWTKKDPQLNPFVEKKQKYKIELQFSEYEIQLIRSTWQQMSSNNIYLIDSNTSPDSTMEFQMNNQKSSSSLFCHQLYSNLLGLDPNLESLFPSIKHQAHSFAGVLQTAIMRIENLSVLDDYLDELGKRHSRILGIESAQFNLMGQALIKTFEDRFNSNFTNDMEDVWIKFYSYLANTIMENGEEDVLNIEDMLDDDWSASSMSLKSELDTTSTNTSYESSSMDNTQFLKTSISTKFQQSRKPSNKNLKATMVTNGKTTFAELTSGAENDTLKNDRAKSNTKSRFANFRNVFDKSSKRTSTIY